MKRILDLALFLAILAFVIAGASLITGILPAIEQQRPATTPTPEPLVLPRHLLGGVLTVYNDFDAVILSIHGTVIITDSTGLTITMTGPITVTEKEE